MAIVEGGGQVQVAAAASGTGSVATCTCTITLLNSHDAVPHDVQPEHCKRKRRLFPRTIRRIYRQDTARRDEIVRDQRTAATRTSSYWNSISTAPHGWPEI